MRLNRLTLPIVAAAIMIAFAAGCESQQITETQAALAEARSRSEQAQTVLTTYVSPLSPLKHGDGVTVKPG
jgi:type IV pilus biogenesis protein CpaD/CtpE